MDLVVPSPPVFAQGQPPPFGSAQSIRGAEMHTKRALKILATLRELEKGGGVVSADIATVEIGLGHKNKTLAALEKTYEERRTTTLYCRSK